MLKAISLTCSTIPQALLLALLLAGATRAHSVEPARAAYAEGRFIHAAELAASLETSEGYALVARSLAIYGYYITRYGEKQALFDRAALLAREAIRLDPANPEAHLELAHVMGRQAQTLGVLKAVNGEGSWRVCCMGPPKRALSSTTGRLWSLRPVRKSCSLNTRSVYCSWTRIGTASRRVTC